MPPTPSTTQPPAAWRVWGFRVTPLRRLGFFTAVDAAATLLAFATAVVVRYEGIPPRAAWIPIAILAAVCTVASIGAFALLRVYRASWSFFSLRDVAAVALGVLGATLAGLALVAGRRALPPLDELPGNLLFIEAPLAFLLIASFRLWPRVRRIGSSGAEKNGVPTLVIGAGLAGGQVIRSILETSAREAYALQGILDDRAATHGTTIHGIQVLGPLSILRQTVERYQVGTVIIALEDARSEEIRALHETAKAAGVREVRTVPPAGTVAGGLTLLATREVSIEDLLGRSAVHVDTEDVRRFLTAKRVLVTGGAGTIGSELCRQVASFAPERLAIVDTDESRLYDLACELRETRPGVEILEVLLDVRDAERVQEIFQDYRPHVVIHAAAYKHVPMMERWPIDGLAVNVLGTSNVIDAAQRAGTSSFVLISTDKAVDPCNVMGATKRMAELLALGQPRGAMRMTAVRFGNVLGSRGSVIPIFERQLRRGGPLTVTHPEIERYFMITSEAVALVLQAASLGQQGLYFLDLGRPVKIADMAREFIRLHGLTPDVDVKIHYTGLRPGERLTEYFTYGDESFGATRHPQIRVAPRTSGALPADVLDRVRKIVAAGDQEAAREYVAELFPLVASGHAAPVMTPVKVVETHEMRTVKRDGA